MSWLTGGVAVVKLDRKAAGGGARLPRLHTATGMVAT